MLGKRGNSTTARTDGTIVYSAEVIAYSVEMNKNALPVPCNQQVGGSIPSASSTRNPLIIKLSGFLHSVD